MKKLPLITATVLILSIVSATSFIEAAAKKGYHSGRFIVKFKSQGDKALNACAHCLLAQKKNFSDDLEDKSSSVDQLIKKFKVKGARDVFNSRHNLTTKQVLETQQKRRDKVKKDFKKRSLRASKKSLPDLSNTYIFEVPSNSNIEEICRIFAADPHVEFAQPDYKMTMNLVPNDFYYNVLYGMQNIKAGGVGLSAWDFNLGENTIAAVVDTGIDYAHPDLVGNIWINPGEDVNNNGIVDGVNTCPTPNGDFNCIDNDGNGLVDDIRGYDFSYCTASDVIAGDCNIIKAVDNNPMDVYGHGTHVAGTIGAVGFNAAGVIGVAPHVKLMPVKGFLDDGTGFDSDLAAGIEYAAMQGADVINNSWGCQSRCPSNPIAEAAVLTAHGLGAVVVFAAGNASDDVAFFSPSNMNETIAVAAVDSADNPASFSNFGTSIDVAAPGVSVYSTYKGGYAYLSGTSMATPHVVGLAALLLSRNNFLTNDDVHDILRSTTDDILTPGFDINSGYGRINALKAMQWALDLESNITEPLAGSSLFPQNGIAEITGNAHGQHFEGYQLFYQSQENISGWTPIQDSVTVPVQNGALGVWDIHAIPVGPYLIRLLTESIFGTTLEDTVSVFIEFLFEQVTEDPADQINPAVDGNNVVFEDYRHGNPEIYLYDNQSNVSTRITNQASGQFDPTISGNNIIYVDDRHGNKEIYRWNMSTSVETRLTNNSNVQEAPDIDGQYVVWQDNRAGNWDIYLRDLNTSLDYPITINVTDQKAPAISGNLIVWQDARNGNWDIYACIFDVQTGSCPQQRITTQDGVIHWKPDVSGQKIVWEDFRNGKADVYLYDRLTQIETRITNDSLATDIPFAIGGDAAVDPNDFRITKFVSGLSFPTDISMLSDGALLVSTNEAGTPAGLFASGGGTIRYLKDTNADGVSDINTVLYTGLPGTQTAIATIDNLIFVNSSENLADAISVLRAGPLPNSPLTYIGAIRLNYSGSFPTIKHKTYELAVRPKVGLPQQYDLYFNVGSKNNEVSSGATVNISGMATGTLNDESIYRISIDNSGATPIFSGLTQIATGLRNAAGMSFDPINGDFYFEDNGIDTPGNENVSFSADELNRILNGNIGGAIEDFGYSQNYTEYSTGNIIGNDSGTFVQPLADFRPVNGYKSEGAVKIAFAPTNFPEGLNKGVFVGFHGKNSLGGLANDENPLVYVDLNNPAHKHFHFIANTFEGVGHLNEVFATNNSLFIADLSRVGGLGGDGNGQGVIYQIATQPEVSSLSPVISGNRVSWIDNRAGNGDVYLYDTATAVTKRVTSHTVDQKNLAISANVLVWQDRRHNNEDIFLYQFGADLPPILNPIGDKTVTDGQVLSFLIAASDPEAGPVSLFAELQNGNAVQTIGAIFTDNGDGTGSFSWLANKNTLGNVFILKFTAIDQSGQIDQENIFVTISDSVPVEPAGIVAHLRLDETTGTVASDSSGNGNNGTKIGAVTLGLPGKIGLAYGFDGISGYVDIGSNAILNVPAGQGFSIAMWVKTTENFGPILSARNSSDGGAVIDIMVGYDGVNNSAGSLMTLVRENNGSAYSNIVGGQINNGAWHHVVLTRNSGSTIELFLDGVSMGTRTSTAIDGAITTNLRGIGKEILWGNVGYADTDKRQLNGQVDDLQIFNRQLTNTEIQNMLITAPDTQAPSVPTGLAGNAVSQTQINLTWNASTDNVGVTGYKVYRDGINVGTSATTNYSDTGLTAGTSYGYRVKAIDAAGNESALSTVVNVTTLTPDTQAPTVPTGLAASVISSTQINLTWNASSDNVAVTGYKIYRGGVNVGTSVSTSYSDTNLTASTSYTYTVKAYDAAGNESAQSSPVTATTLANTGPLGLIAHLNLDETTGTIANDSSGNGNNGTKIGGVTLGLPGKINTAYGFDGISGHVDIGSNSILNVPAGQGFSMAMWVKTTENFGPIMSFRNSVDGGAIIDIVVGFDGVNNSAGSLMTLVRENNGSSYSNIIGGQINNGAWHHVVLTRNAGSTIELFLDGVSMGTRTSTAIDGPITSNLRGIGKEILWGNVNYSDNDRRQLNGQIDDVQIFNRQLTNTEIQNMLITAPDTQAPTIPTGLAGNAISQTQINLTWNASTDNVGVTGYKVYRDGINAGTAVSTSYSDTGLTAGTSYGYRVKAIDAAGNESALSTVVNVTTLTPDTQAPTVPTGLAASVISSTQINLTWNASTDNVGVTGYKIYRGGVNVGTSVSTSYSDTNLTASTSYTYTVKAYDAAGNESGLSSPVSATTLAVTGPVGLIAHLRLDEATGTVANDSSGNGNNGTKIGGVTLGLPGKINTAYGFDGVSGYVDIGTNAILNVPVGQGFSMAMWVKTTESFGPILSARNGSDGGAVIDIMVGYDGVNSSAGSLMTLVRENNGSSYSNIVGGQINNGAWHHVVLTRNAASTIELFLDGVSMGTRTSTAIDGPITTNLRGIGKEILWGNVSYADADKRQLNGQVDDVQIYNRQLTNTEIQNLFNL